MAEDAAPAGRSSPGEAGGQRRPRMSRLAVWAFVFSLFGFFFPAIALSVTLGLMARREIEDSPDRLRGRGLAVAASTVSMAWLVVFLFLLGYSRIWPELAGH